MIIRLARKNRFTVIDNTIIEDKSLTWAARALLIYLLSKPDDWKVQVSQLVKAGDLGPDGIYARLKELQQAGYAKHEQRRDHKGRIVGSDWFIADEPQFKGSPDRDIPDLDENRITTPFSPDRAQPDLAEPDLANPALLITELLPSTENTNGGGDARARAREDDPLQPVNGRQEENPPCPSQPPADPSPSSPSADDPIDLDRLTGKKPPVNPLPPEVAELVMVVRKSGLVPQSKLIEQATPIKLRCERWAKESVTAEELSELISAHRAEQAEKGNSIHSIAWFDQPVARLIQAKENPAGATHTGPGPYSSSNNRSQSHEHYRPRTRLEHHQYITNHLMQGLARTIAAEEMDRGVIHEDDRDLSGQMVNFILGFDDS